MNQRKQLSLREQEIARLIWQGYYNKEIAFKLQVGEPTVRVYASRIYDKLNIRNRTDLALWYERQLKASLPADVQAAYRPSDAA